jgi:Coenzyme PQQ synthesis protein D (PqqD)
MEADRMNEIYIARSTAVASRVLDGEIVIMSAVDSTLFSLSEVATVIWQAADGRTPLSEIVRSRICAEFDVAPDAAYRDAEAFIDDLARHGILRVSSAPISRDEPQVAAMAASIPVRTA